jgi:pyruvate dehydrogenase E1 component alpha subunit
MDIDGPRSPEQVIAGLRATSEGEDLVQLLTPEGQRVPHSQFDLEISPAELQSLYRDMVLVRRADREAKALQRQGELGLWAPLLGQEAAQIGAGRAMAPQDMAFPSYREHGVAWCRGVDPSEIFGIFRGVDQGSWDPIGTGFQLYTIVIPNQCLHATGYAMGQRLDGKIGDADNAEATICFFGDGATSQGDVHEGFVWASVYDAPVVFFCQNNQWAISTPTSTQMGAPLHQRAAGFGLRTYHVDGNDVHAVHAVRREAADRVRAGEGPALIEAETFRMAGHSTSDDPGRYRPQADVDLWQSRDPLTRSEALLRTLGTPDEWFEQLSDELTAFGDEIRETCRGLAGPEFAELFGAVYSDPHSILDLERADHLRHREGSSQ